MSFRCILILSSHLLVSFPMVFLILWHFHPEMHFSSLYFLLFIGWRVGIHMGADIWNRKHNTGLIWETSVFIMLVTQRTLHCTCNTDIWRSHYLDNFNDFCPRTRIHDNEISLIVGRCFYTDIPSASSKNQNILRSSKNAMESWKKLEI